MRHLFLPIVGKRLDLESHFGLTTPDTVNGLSNIRRWLVLAAFLFAPFLYAKRYVLFTAPGVQADGYDKATAELALSNDSNVIVFSDGTEFTVTKGLGSGNTTLILALSADRAIRIPLKSGEYTYGLGLEAILDSKQNGVEFPLYTAFINYFVLGHRILTTHEVEVVEMHAFLKDEYVIVDRIEPKFTYRYYLENRPGFPPELLKKIDEDLLEWIRKTASIATLSDFHFDQLVYTKDGWKIIDFTHKATDAKFVRDHALFAVTLKDRLFNFLGFHSGLTLPLPLLGRAKSILYQERRNAGLPWGIGIRCSRAIEFFSDVIKNERQRRRVKEPQTPPL